MNVEEGCAYGSWATALVDVRMILAILGNTPAIANSSGVSQIRLIANIGLPLMLITRLCIGRLLCVEILR